MKKIQVTVGIPKDMLREVERLAPLEHRNRSEFISHALAEYLNGLAVSRLGTATPEAREA